MKRIYNFFHAKYDKKIDGTGLAVFRILFSFILLIEIIDLYHYRQLFFDPIPFLVPSEIDTAYGLVAWMITVFSLMIGFKTKICSILNYCFLLVFIATMHTYEYHMFYAYMGIGFLLMFLPLENSLSLDRLIVRIKNTDSKYTHTPDTKVSRLYYFLPVYVAIGLVYIDSVFYKSTSPFWMEGLGMWRPGVLPHFNKFGEHFTLNVEWLTRFLGYLTLVFETVFIFLFWYKKFRLPLLIIGLGLHLGILLFFPIPLFALGVSAIYLLMVPVSFWKKLKVPFSNKTESLVFLYDTDCPLCARTKLTIQTFDIFKRIRFQPVQDLDDLKKTYPSLENKNEMDLLLDVHSVNRSGKAYSGLDSYIQVLMRMIYTFPLAILLMIPGIYHLSKFIYRKIALNRERVPCTEQNCEIRIPVGINQNENRKLLANVTIKNLIVLKLAALFIGLTFIQTSVSYDSGIIKDWRKDIGLSGTRIDGFLLKISNLTNRYSKKLFGITHHPVFMDGHMDRYDHIIAVVYEGPDEKIWLPIIDQNGQPGKMIYGPRWVKWTFRVNSPYLNKQNLEKGLRDFTAFWLGKNNMKFDGQKFTVKLKRIESPMEFEKDFLSNQMKKPWEDFGEIEWSDKKYQIRINYDLLKNK